MGSMAQRPVHRGEGVDGLAKVRRHLTNAAPDGRAGEGARLRRALLSGSPAGECNVEDVE